MSDIISVRDLDREEIDKIITTAINLKQDNTFLENKAQGKVMASLFFENSTRTRESHGMAAQRLGMKIIGFSGIEGTSVKKGEPLADTVRMYAGYGTDLVVIRHNLDGAARYVADLLPIPVINAGDGANSHPTQTLLDLMTIKEAKGHIDNLKIALVGDLKYGRTVHSLLQGLSFYNYVEVVLVAPPSLQMPQHFIDNFVKKGGRVTITENIHEALSADILYMTRIQRERFPRGPEGEYEYQKVQGTYRITPQLLAQGRADLKLMHPLPRVKEQLEISLDVDNTDHALYFEQARNGMFIRQVVINKLLLESKKKDLPESNGSQLWQDLPIEHGSKKGERLLYRLDDGILIDHIEQGRGLTVYHLLALENLKQVEIVPALNIKSSKYGRKDVLAIHNITLEPKQLWKVYLVSERATINIIENQDVTKKGRVVLPSCLEGLVICRNINCISRPEHHEQAVSKFHVESQSPLLLRCHYCEKTLKREQIEFV
ncbi:hypothetical protein COV20_05850 [Candidatus Woesearchaeota archaeon CG10_big_fil_rev_8_21_14_0_10_45_16]|nr:MAG: hypothetical protein COV20_05850 [Candidatus Woesearchaeota archaeon CG10_big_fil_rev_8_21_14_0_10_45_16]